MRIYRIKQSSVAESYKDYEELIPGSKYTGNRIRINSETHFVDLHHYSEFPGMDISVTSVKFDEDTVFKDVSEDSNVVVFQFSLQSFLRIKQPNETNETIGINKGVSMYNTKFPFELIIPKNTEVNFVTMRFKLDMITGFKNAKWIELEDLLFNPKPWILYESLNLEMEQILKEIFSIQKKRKGKRGYTIAKSMELITSFFISLSERQNQKDAIGNITIAPELLLQIKEDLVQDFEHPVSIEELASKYGMSTQKLRVNFKIFFGKSPNQLWQQLRYEEADRRLKYTDEPISNIALSLGFNDATHFAKGFKKSRGVSPKEFRKG